nr:MAG TPA: hypothetical protein [Caudoviricetes sp.]
MDKFVSSHLRFKTPAFTPVWVPQSEYETVIR